MTYLELEREIAKISLALMVRNSQLGKDLITALKTQLPLKAVAEIVIVCIERVLWFDSHSIAWSIENLIPVDVKQEIQKTFLVHFYKQLIGAGFTPGKDFSIDANSQLLLNLQAKSSLLRYPALKVENVMF